MSDKRLKYLAERIEKLMDERDAIQGDIRDIYAEAKSAGYVPKVLRKAITRKRMDPDKRDEEDTILDLYEDALSPKMRRAVQMAAAGATSREIEAETGLDHVTVTRSVSLNKKSETPHDADGVITETQEKNDAAADRRGDHAGVAEDEPVGSLPAADEERADDADFDAARKAVWTAPDPVTVKRTLEQGGEAPATPSVGAVGPSSGRVAPPTDAEALDALDKSWEALKSARARRQTEGVGV